MSGACNKHAVMQVVRREAPQLDLRLNALEMFEQKLILEVAAADPLPFTHARPKDHFRCGTRKRGARNLDKCRAPDRIAVGCRAPFGWLEDRYTVIM